MTRRERVPQRSCVACRQVRPKRELLRVVRTPEGEVRVDAAGKASGRGAYVCRDERCAQQAVKQKKLARALGVPVGEELLEAIGRNLG
ncbi:MAG TPA: YlxR family protein [Armatimonadota bacterium]|nr:YlxR family protein [Armatimonadota bacterium]